MAVPGCYHKPRPELEQAVLSLSPGYGFCLIAVLLHIPLHHGYQPLKHAS